MSRVIDNSVNSGEEYAYGMYGSVTPASSYAEGSDSSGTTGKNNRMSKASSYEAMSASRSEAGILEHGESKSAVSGHGTSEDSDISGTG